MKVDKIALIPMVICFWQKEKFAEKFVKVESFWTPVETKVLLNVENCRFCHLLVYTVDNIKTHPPVFQPLVFPIYLRNRLSYKKIYFIFLHPFLKSFQLEQKKIKSGD